MKSTLGDELVSLISEAQYQVVLAAPFMKERVVEKLLANVDQEVVITCVTRWRPEEVRVGVSDLGVWKIIRGRDNARLLLRNDLHAKYYRSDGQCLIGSANLTARALGWSANPNFELLVHMDAKTDPLPASEQDLVRNAVVVDQKLADEFEAIMSILPPIAEYAEEELPPSGVEMLRGSNERIWIPMCRYPEHLFRVYSGEFDGISAGGVEAAEQDLAYVSLPPRLTQAAFNAAVHGVLIQTPILGRLESFLDGPRRFGEMRSYLRSMPDLENEERDSTELWQTLMRWLLHFVPSRYQLAVPNYSEIILRIRTDSEPEDAAENNYGPPG